MRTQTDLELGVTAHHFYFTPSFILHLFNIFLPRDCCFWTLFFSKLFIKSKEKNVWMKEIVERHNFLGRDDFRHRKMMHSFVGCVQMGSSAPCFLFIWNFLSPYWADVSREISTQSFGTSVSGTHSFLLSLPLKTWFYPTFIGCDKACFFGTNKQRPCKQTVKICLCFPERKGKRGRKRENRAICSGRSENSKWNTGKKTLWE